jgi:signal transduction histidine kinase
VEEATALLEGTGFDVVLSDIILPRINGVELLRRLSETQPRVPVIMMTGEPTVETATEALRAEAFDYLVKPVAKNDVIKAVANAARLKEVDDDRHRLEEENERYQQHLEEVVQKRTEDLRRSEEQLRQAQKMEAIGKFAGGVAHDFNNLLMVIGGSAQFLLDEDGLSESGQRDLDEILAATSRASDLTRQLLAFSRKQTLVKETLDLANVVRGISKMLQRLLGEDVTLELNVLEGPHAVVVDPGQIEQVLMNLASNARDAMPRGGALTITLDRYELDEQQIRQMGDPQCLIPGPYVRLSVSDTGEGIDEETQGMIFDPFFTTKNEGEGTGLGLSTVYGIVCQHDGHIAVQSAPGCGATFRIFLPAAPDNACEISDRSTDDLPMGTDTILFVEDDPRVSRIGKRMLANLGYNVHSAQTSDEALQLAQQYGPEIDLLLTDVIMPGLNGPELARRIRDMHPQIKVLYASGYPADHLNQRGITRQHIALLRKPFVSRELAKKLREVLEAPAE